MLKLHKLKSLVKKRKRIGRGGSRGGTATKGHKGQIARSGGKIRKGFEGGQMPLFRRSPKRGFSNFDFQKEVVTVNIARLESLYESGTHVDRESLIKHGAISINKGVQPDNIYVKILGTGTLTKKLLVSADMFSASAKKAIESLGGEARVRKEI